MDARLGAANSIAPLSSSTSGGSPLLDERWQAGPPLSVTGAPHRVDGLHSYIPLGALPSGGGIRSETCDIHLRSHGGRLCCPLLPDQTLGSPGR